MTTTLTRNEIECLCPFCGAFNSEVGRPCPQCAIADTRDTREAAKSHFGSWAVLTVKSPTAAGVSFATLRAMIQRGDVTERSIVRGPTTGQLWRLASKVRGLSREFGSCYNCGGDVEQDTVRCHACDRLQTLPESAAPRSSFTDRRRATGVPTGPITSDPVTSELVTADRPPRKIPKEDLLQPKDIAKAFQLNFGVPSVTEFLSDPPPSKTRKVRIAFAVAGTAMTIALLAPLAAAVIGRADAVPAAPPVVATTIRPVAKPAAIKRGVTEPRLVSAKLDADNAVEAEPSVVVVSPRTVEPVVPESQPIRLWRQAIAAESRGQYAAAVKLYRQIESLPGDAWPDQLQSRLKRAKVELASIER